jgi:sulfate adenylyltransferase
MGLFCMGATHHMFGRDHTNVGYFFDTYAVHALWTRGLPSYGIDKPPHQVDKGLRIRLLCWESYCPKCGEWTYQGGPGEGPLCGHEVERVSGSPLWTAVREPSALDIYI